LKPSGAPNCCRSQQNLTIQFLKLDCLVSIVLSRGFWSLFIWCDNTPQAATPTGGHPRITAKGADRRGHSVDFPQSWGSAASPVRTSCEDVSVSSIPPFPDRAVQRPTLKCKRLWLPGIWQGRKPAMPVASGYGCKG
jgi:hypothetical protein